MTSADEVIDGPFVEVLIFSLLSPSAPRTTFDDVCRRSRVNNPALNIGGALLFDGSRFCQLLTGRQHLVSALADRISHDSRHYHWRILAKGDHHVTKESLIWLSGYAEASDLTSVVQSSVADCFRGFRSILPRADTFP